MKCRNKFKKLASSKYGESSKIPQENVEKNCESQVPKRSDGGEHAKTKHKCQFCENLFFENKLQLYNHYLSKHFKADILARIDGNKCRLCGYENVRRYHLLRHVGTCNDLIGQLLHGGEIVKKKCPEIVKKKVKNIKCPLCFNLATISPLSTTKNSYLSM